MDDMPASLLEWARSQDEDTLVYVPTLTDQGWAVFTLPRPPFYSTSLVEVVGKLAASITRCDTLNKEHAS
ncbi:hypothetical protein [Rhabdothermincola salaria]|uniref:hypothetical protein n=1 Tax=Rhabdothermincola salaria TaxID=2903142 RepID=UPI001E42D42B|nr:hypothetical protein [Rhabdothermincola salaria]MCD9625278.1 hypothetical protein [Rhabdothermincola salaria]